MKRKPRVVPPWDDYFMALAFFVDSRSKDPYTQHGSIVVHESTHFPIGWGYNGPPASIIDTEIDWTRPNKYPFIIHAEVNAVDACPSNTKFDDCTVYVTGTPCKRCMLYMIKKKIKKIIFGPQSSNMVDEKDWQITKEMVKLARGTTLERYQGNLNWVRDRIQWMTENQPEVFQPVVPIPL
jgi:dCMP deaminase